MNEREKILAGVRPATIANIKVTPSCGCVFCDIMVPKDTMGIHRAHGNEIACTRAQRNSS